MAVRQVTRRGERRLIVDIRYRNPDGTRARYRHDPAAYATSHLKPSMRVGYEQKLGSLLNAIGDLPITQITPSKVRELTRARGDGRDAGGTRLSLRRARVPKAPRCAKQARRAPTPESLPRQADLRAAMDRLGVTVGPRHATTPPSSHRFEAAENKLFAPVAQWIEQRFPKPLVGRSIRLGGARVFPGSRVAARFSSPSYSEAVTTLLPALFPRTASPSRSMAARRSARDVWA